VSCAISFNPASTSRCGAFGSKDRPWTKEQADYNLKYLIAAALLDDAVGPAQLEPSRIRVDLDFAHSLRVARRIRDGSSCAGSDRIVQKCRAINISDCSPPAPWSTVCPSNEGAATGDVEAGLKISHRTLSTSSAVRPLSRLSFRTVQHGLTMDERQYFFASRQFR